MEDILKSALYLNIEVDFVFEEEQEQPTSEDLFTLCGFTYPGFPVSGQFNFGALASLGFEQVDDYFGIPSHEEAGDDVPVWLFPLIDNEPIYHHPGPFSGLRLSYFVLRNSPAKIDFFLKVITDFARELPAKVIYRNRDVELGTPPDVSVLQSDMNQIVEHWRSQGTEPGSKEALRISR